jgi:endoglucanase
MLFARFRKGIAIFATATLALSMTATPTLGAAPEFYVPPADKGAAKQIKDLVKQGDLTDAALLTSMVAQGHAVWFTGGTPDEVFGQVRRTMMLAKVQHTVPVLVAYNLPFRDCGQYSAGGALNTADYKAWIDGFAAGIGTGKAMVILEPDGLGIIPYYTPIYGPMEWCQPDLSGTGLNPATVVAARFEQMNYAVDRLKQQANTSVYLDGTNAAWLGVGEAADRLIKAGVQRADGFDLNVSNYLTTPTSTIFGTWVSTCIAQSAANSWWNPGWCPSQYNPATSYGLDYSPEYVASVNLAIAGYAAPTTHFVIDTSRNGQGAWAPAPGVYSGDPQVWCNPPGRGLGIPPTTNTGNALIDAYLWVKVPGESDGQCNRSVAGSTTDPEWGGIVDPAAGSWFPQMALQLVQNANPVLP